MPYFEQFRSPVRIHSGSRKDTFIRIPMYLATGFGLSDTQLNQLQYFFWKCCFPLYLWEMIVSGVYLASAFICGEILQKLLCELTTTCEQFNYYHGGSSTICTRECGGSNVRQYLFKLGIFFAFLAAIRIPAIIYRFIKAIAYCCCHRTNPGMILVNPEEPSAA